MSHRSYRLHTVVAILLLASASAAQAQPTKDKGPDYSVRGGEYSVLNNLMMYEVEKLEYVSTVRIEAYGVKYTAAKFLAQAKVSVTVDGEEGYGEAYGRHTVGATAEFEVLVGLDAGDEIHDRMLKSIRDYWAFNKPGKRRKVDAGEHLNYKDGEYVMFLALRGRFLEPRAKRLVWVDGKVIKFEFRRFLYGDKYNEDDALENFVGSCIRLRVGSAEIQLKQMKGAFREEFFEQYNKGVFKGVM